MPYLERGCIQGHSLAWNPAKVQMYPLSNKEEYIYKDTSLTTLPVTWDNLMSKRIKNLSYLLEQSLTYLVRTVEVTG